MRKFPAWLVTLAVLLSTGMLTLLAVLLLRDTLHYPRLTMTVGSEMQIDIVRHGIIDAPVCRARLSQLVETITKGCPPCRITASSCATTPSPDLLQWLSSAPLDLPSTRLADGVVVYRSTTPGLADASCAESQRQAASMPAAPQVRCFTAGARRQAND